VTTDGRDTRTPSTVDTARPDGLRDNEWAAYQVLIEGGSLTEAAKAAGVKSAGTVEGWKKKHGWEFSGARLEKARVQTEAARRTRERNWLIRRTEEQDAAGIHASATRNKLWAIIEQVDPAEASKDPAMLKAVTAAYVALLGAAQDLANTGGQQTDTIEGDPVEMTVAEEVEAFLASK